MTGYDIIGDVHGCAAELTALLGELGYARDESSVYRHPDRTAVFVGDLVDRGKEQLEVLRTVKAMVDAGSAQIVMGNHEFNAVCYTTRDPRRPWKYLREHKGKKKEEHEAFLALNKADRKHYIKWFKTLPLWLELTGPDGHKLRVIHACWHEPSMKVVAKHCGGSNRLLTMRNFAKASRKHSELYEAIEILLKGPEIALAEPFLDHGGTKRTKARIRWWLPNARTLRDIADVRGMKTLDDEPYPELPDDPVENFDSSLIYEDAVPVVYGHYWFNWDSYHENWTEYTACVDFGAVGDAGRLVAYRWDGQPTITWKNYVPHTADVVERTPSD